MSITSYPRVTIQGTGNVNNPQNGFGTMVWNTATSRYELLTAQTFAGLATNSLQNTIISNQGVQITQFNNSSTIGLLTDTLLNINLTSTLTALSSITCKYVTLYLETDLDVQINGSGAISKFKFAQAPVIRLFRSNASQIAVAEGGGGSGTLNVVVTQ